MQVHMKYLYIWHMYIYTYCIVTDAVDFERLAFFPIKLLPPESPFHFGQARPVYNCILA